MLTIADIGEMLRNLSEKLLELGVIVGGLASGSDVLVYCKCHSPGSGHIVGKGNWLV